MISRAATLLPLAALLVACGEPERDRFRPDAGVPADRGGPSEVRLLDTEAAVVEKIGRPSIGIEQKIRGKRWTRWTYSSVSTDWQPYEDDIGVRPRNANDFSEHRVRDELQLTFLDGRLRVIEDLATGSVVSDLYVPGDKDALERFERGLGEEP